MLFVSSSAEQFDEVIRIAYIYLVFMSACLPVLYLLHLYRSALQGMGDTVTPMISGMVELAMRVSAVLILPVFIGEFGVYFAEVAAWIGAELLLMIAYYHKIRALERN